MSVDSRHLLWFEATGDVAVLRWPEQDEERVRLEHVGLPRLLVLEPDTDPPETASCLEDWIRVPARDEDVRSRIATLRAHSLRHPPAPTIDRWGQLSYRNDTVFLSPTEHAIATLLVEHFGSGVREGELLEHGWPAGDGGPSALRVQMHRLRKRLTPLGLTVRSLHGRGYAMLARTDPRGGR